MSTPTLTAVLETHVIAEAYRSVFSPILKERESDSTEMKRSQWVADTAWRSFPCRPCFARRTLSETRGFMKALISHDTEEILGFTAVGPHEGEILELVQTAMMGNCLITLRDTVFTHPTMAEGLGPPFGGVPQAGQR